MANEFLINIGILLFFAIIGGIIAIRLKQPAVIGLLLVGAIIGPNFLNLVNDTAIIAEVADIGVILLLFAIGLEFVMPKLIKMGFKALLLGFLKIGIVFFMTYETMFLFGFDNKVALIFGIILSFSSTVVIVKILESKNLYNRQEMPLLMGVLIVEDIFSILILSFFSASNNNVGMISIIEKIVVSLTILIVIYLVIVRFSKIVFEWLLKNSKEETNIMFLGLALCAGFSYLAYFLGLSPSIGAFLAGSIIGSLPDVKQFHHAITPYTSMFTALFFISMGTLVQFSVIKTSFPLILLLLIILAVTRFIGVGLVGYMFANFKKDQIIFSSIAFFAASEFALIVAKSAASIVPDIDIVSISAALIFITAIIFSVTVSSYSKLFEAVDGMVPRDWKNSSGSLADYIRLSFDELDTENVHSKKLKKYLSKSFLQILSIIFAIIILKQINIYTISYHSNIITYGTVFVFSALMLLIGYFAYQNGKSAYLTLIMLLSNLAVSRSIIKSRHIVNNLIVMLGLITLLILTPIIITIWSLSGMFNLVAIGLIGLIFISIRRTTRLLCHFHSTRTIFPRYRKVSDFMPQQSKDEF
jgi:CPA2 family monovalent cation:H+ antiporter-2